MPFRVPHDRLIEHHPYGLPVLHFVFTIALIVALVALAVWLVTSARRPTPSAVVPLPPSAADSAIQHARMRYARGEMTREEFLQVVADLGDSTPASPV